MKVIETKYKGYIFRSRLEARWAVFFDCIGWEWLYEAEGYDLGFGRLYLPDFQLGPDTWVEVKPFAPRHEEIRKARALAARTNGTVIFAVGVPDVQKINNLQAFDGTYQTDVSLADYCCSKWGRPGYSMGDPFDVLTNADVDACEAARAARFDRLPKRVQS